MVKKLSTNYKQGGGAIPMLSMVVPLADQVQFFEYANKVYKDLSTRLKSEKTALSIRECFTFAKKLTKTLYYSRFQGLSGELRSSDEIIQRYLEFKKLDLPSSSNVKDDLTNLYTKIDKFTNKYKASKESGGIFGFNKSAESKSKLTPAMITDIEAIDNMFLRILFKYSLSLGVSPEPLQPLFNKFKDVKQPEALLIDSDPLLETSVDRIKLLLTTDLIGIPNIGNIRLEVDHLVDEAMQSSHKAISKILLIPII